MKIVRQDGLKDCGVCCLLSIIKFYGGNLSLEYLREITNTNKSGVSAYNLVFAMKRIGFDAFGVSGNVLDIDSKNLPCIAHLIINKKYKHFVVIYDIDKRREKVIIMDPAIGKRVLTFAQFRLLSSSNYIYLKPIKKLACMSNKKMIAKFIKELFDREKISLILIFILTSLYFILQIIVAFHFKYLLEYCINYYLVMDIKYFSIYLLSVYIIKDIANLFRNLLLTKLINISDSLMSLKTYEHILLLPYIYYKNRTTGEVVARLRDLNIVKNFIAQVSCFFITDFIGSLFFLIVLFKISRKITFYILLFSILLIFVYIFFSNKKVKSIRKVSKREADVNSYLVESLTNVDTIKGSHIEKRLRDVFLIKYRNMLDSVYRLSFMEQIIGFVKDIFNDLLTTIVLGVGSFLIITKKLLLGEVIVYQSVFNYYLNSFYNLISIFNNYHSFKVAASRIEDLFLINKEEFRGSYYYLTNRLDGTIKFCHLNYSVFNKVIFKDLNLEILSGQKILLLGKSGVGKSSLVKILLRYIEVPFGSVSIKDIDINHYHLEVIRKNITYVSSLEFLFTNTLYNNITLNKEIDKEKFEYICSICEVDELVDDSLGYERLVEENGFNFSNGERQRIILARSLLRDADIYIFDEAFSQIDKGRRNVIIGKIFKYLEGKTIIVISHNINKLNLFDRVLRLEDGKVFEVKKI